MVFAGYPPLVEEKYIENRTVRVSVIYVYSRTQPVEGWKEQVSEAIPLVNEFYSKYVNYNWRWTLYEIYSPDLDPLAEDYSIYHNEHAIDALPSIYRMDPVLAQKIHDESDIIYVFINSRVGAEYAGFVLMNAILAFTHHDKYINAHHLAHEIAHLFGAYDLYEYPGNPYYDPDDPDNPYDIMMGGGFDPSDPFSYPPIFGKRSLSFLHLEYVRKATVIGAFLFEYVSLLWFWVTDKDLNKLSGVEIAVNGLIQYTDDSGSALFGALLNEEINYTISKLGYETQSGIGKFIVYNNRIDIKLIEEEPTPPPTQHTLTIQSLGNGSTVPTLGTYLYDEGTIIQVTAYPSSNWEFYRWNLNGSYYYENPISIQIISDSVLTAIFSEISPPPDEFSCPYCGDVFYSQAELDAHILVEHPVEPPPEEFPCPYCGQIFYSQAELDWHILVDHQPPPPPPTSNGIGLLIPIIVIAGLVVLFKYRK